jgi:hypothetical protein
MTLYVFGFDASDSIDIILAVFSYCCIDKKIKKLTKLIKDNSDSLEAKFNSMK